jgi:hypothetical protein
MNFKVADTRAVNINFGPGTATVNVRGTGVPTNLFNAAAATVNIGDGNSVAGIQGTLNLENEPSHDTVNINDQNDTTFRTAALATVVQRGSTLGQLSGLAPARISWDYPDTARVNIGTGGAGARVTVLGTGVPTFITGNTLGTNTLVGADVLTTWNVTGADAGNFSNALASATFTGFQNLTSGNVYDRFYFSNQATLSGTLTGGGENVLGLAAYTTDLTVNITGGGAGNIPGVVPHFLGIQYMAAGHGNDRFVFGNSGSITSIDGGPGGTDTLDASAVNRNLSVLGYGANAGTVPGVVFEFYDIENVTGGIRNNTFVFVDGASLAGTLTGGGGINTIDASPYSTGLVYSINAANGGSVGGVVGTFANIQNLIGAGAGGNDFAFSDGGSLAGRLDGGVGGNNTLDYSGGWSGNVVADLRTGAASGLAGLAPGRLANIQNVLGAGGGGVGRYNLLIGNGGNTLTGGFGRRNILVAGGGASTLNAGDQDDLLIGGTTVYDTEAGLASWQQIAAYWAGTDVYATRVANLTSGSGVPLLDATTVTGNGGGNVFRGNGGTALVYTDGLDTLFGFGATTLVSIAP